MKRMKERDNGEFFVSSAAGIMNFETPEKRNNAARRI
jgi:hypothetical protein